MSKHLFQSFPFLNKISSKKITEAYSRASFVDNDILNFLKYVDIGNIAESNFPINLLITPLTEKEILSRPVAGNLFMIYLISHNLYIIENNMILFTINDNIEKYLNSYIEIMETKDKNFNRNKFSQKQAFELINLSMIKRKDLTETEKNLLKNTENLLSKIQQILFNTYTKLRL